MNYIISSIILLAVVLIIIYILSIDNNSHKFKNKFSELFSVVKSKKINYLNDKDTINILEFIKSHLKTNDNIIVPSKIFYIKTKNGFEMNNINIICYKYINNIFQEIPYIVDVLFIPFEKENYISNQTLFGLHGNYTINIHSNQSLNNISAVSSVPVPSTPVSPTPVSPTPVSPTPVSSTPVSSTPVSSTPVSSTPVSSTPVLVAQTPVSDVTISTPIVTPKIATVSEVNKKSSIQNEQSKQVITTKINKREETLTDVLDMIPDIIQLSDESSEIETTDTEKLISHNIK